MTQLVIVGGGKMGEALLAGLLEAKKYTPDEVVVVEPIPQRCAELTERYGVTAVPEVDPNANADIGGAYVILATKPGTIPAVAAAAAEYASCILSIAAGVTLDTLTEATKGITPHVSSDPKQVPLIRCMPNTPALVGQGAAAICANEPGQAHLDWAEGVLSAVGVVVRASEADMDAVTGLSGSGPAYVFLVAEALIDAGVAVGLTRPVATELATQTLLGASTLLREGTPAAELRANVTSPGGTTAAGLKMLEQGAVRAAFAAAVEAATERSAELGRTE